MINDAGDASDNRSESLSRLAMTRSEQGKKAEGKTKTTCNPEYKIQNTKAFYNTIAALIVSKVLRKGLRQELCAFAVFAF